MIRHGNPGFSEDKLDPLVSIVIRNRNEAAHLTKVFESLQTQRYKNFEVVLVDNNSTDNSIELAKAIGANVIEIDKFTYGSALNAGISKARGELIVILSAHSIPVGRYFLTECVSAFSDTKAVAARLVYVGKGADMARWVNPDVLRKPSDDFVSKGPLASGCVLRRSVWEAIPFDENVVAAEDKIWAEEVLSRGYAILSPIPAFYYYSKKLTPLAELNKNYKELVAIHSHCGVKAGFVDANWSSIFGRFTKASIGCLSSCIRALQYEAIKVQLSLRFPKERAKRLQVFSEKP